MAGALIVLPLAFGGICLAFGPGPARAALFYGLGCALLGIAAGWLLGRRHPALQIAASALPAAALALAVPLDMPYAVIARYALMGLGALLAIWSERRFAVPAGDSMKNGLLLAPLVSLLAASAVLWFSQNASGNPAQGAWGLLAAVGAVWFALAVFLMNRSSLRNAAHAERSAEVPAGARRSGTAGALVFLAAAFALANVDAIVRFLGAAFRQLVVWLIAAWLFLCSLLPASSDQAPAPTGSPEEMQLPPAEGGPSPLAELISNILIGLVLVAVAAAILYGLYRLVPKLVQRIRERFGRLFASWREEDEGFSDRSESLMSLRQAFSDAGDRFRKFARRLRRRPRIGDFPTNAGKARFLFRELLHALKSAGREPPPGATATEVAKKAPGLAPVYNRARYAGEEPSDEEIERARESLAGKTSG
jgi:hypothetical protein